MRALLVSLLLLFPAAAAGETPARAPGDWRDTLERAARAVVVLRRSGIVVDRQATAPTAARTAAETDRATTSGPPDPASTPAASSNPGARNNNVSPAR